jgi:hypothetical protein
MVQEKGQIGDIFQSQIWTTVVKDNELPGILIGMDWIKSITSKYNSTQFGPYIGLQAAAGVFGVRGSGIGGISFCVNNFICLSLGFGVWFVPSFGQGWEIRKPSGELRAGLVF